jgi:lipid II:glycine glycyltransferase (peptidoglycan interpeptide bridge formation enzyme)
MLREWKDAARAAERAGVVIEQSVEQADLQAFYDLCKDVSARKSFALPGSLELMRALLAPALPTSTQARLFVARWGGKVVAGALMIRVGASLHYMWGATDRGQAKLRAGESLQGAVMSWAIDSGCRLYDMEGIDPATNPGVAAFKRRSGGAEAALPGMLAYPLSARGRAAAFVGASLARLRAVSR